MSGASSRNIGGSVAAAFLVLLLAESAPAQDRIAASSYRQFWLWGGVKSGAFLGDAETLYILQGQIAGGGVFIRQGGAPAAIAIPELYLVYRLQSLDWHPTLLVSILNQIAAWEHAGSRVAGIELDFDARTPRLAEYAAFLRDIRAVLPRAYRLGVTGLLDWSTGGSPEAFQSLAGTVDEIVFQTYRGRQAIPGYRDYLAAIARLRLPFKIGIVEGGAWDRAAEGRLASSPFYRGVVVFLTTHR
jgi:hypothetical protein